jgi:hypothetical protein
MVEASQPFDVEDIKTLTETILEDDGKYFDPIVPKDLKMFILAMFEKGHIPGYLLSTKYICDARGPKVVLEFLPENGLSSLDLIDKPEKGRPVKSVLHTQYKELLELICKKAGCTQDMMVRSILVRALDLINDQLK